MTLEIEPRRAEDGAGALQGEYVMVRKANLSTETGIVKDVGTVGLLLEEVVTDGVGVARKKTTFFPWSSVASVLILE